jgi:hypothetical protein
LRRTNAAAGMLALLNALLRCSAPSAAN